MNRSKPKVRAGDMDIAAAKLNYANRSLNKSQSAPTSGGKSWIVSKFGVLIQFLSSIDPSSRDRAVSHVDTQSPAGGTSASTEISAVPRVQVTAKRDNHAVKQTAIAKPVKTETPSARQVNIKPTEPGRIATMTRNFRTFIHSIGRSSETESPTPVPDHDSRPTPPGASLMAQPRIIMADGAARRSADDNNVINVSRNVALMHVPPHDTTAQQLPETNVLALAEDLPAGMDRPVWCIEDYAHLEKVHEGYASSVYRAQCRLTKRKVVLKIYHPDLLHEISRHQLLREARLHASMSHPNIVKMYAAFKQADGVVLVQEYADGGDLLQLLVKSGARLSERTTVALVVQPLLKAIYYLHSKFIIHRDIKLENILFSGPEMTLKLADFGLCLNLREERSVTRAGTLDYMAPEVLKCPTKEMPEDNKHRTDLAYTIAVDVWAVGVLTYELLNGVPPYTRRHRDETEQLIMRAGQPLFLVHASDVAKNFVYSCLARKSHLRPSAWQLLRFPWVKSAPRPVSNRASGSGGEHRKSLHACWTSVGPKSVQAQPSQLSAKAIRGKAARISAASDSDEVVYDYEEIVPAPKTEAEAKLPATSRKELALGAGMRKELSGLNSPTPSPSAPSKSAMKGSSSSTAEKPQMKKSRMVTVKGPDEAVASPAHGCSSVGVDVLGVAADRSAFRAAGTRKLERSVSELSRHTTETGYASAARSRRTDASSGQEDSDDDEVRLPGSRLKAGPR